MTTFKIAGLAAATFIIASASAFAQDATTAQPAMPAKPATHAQKVALEKSCAKEWSVDKKAGKTHDITHKTFISECMKKGV